MDKCDFTQKLDSMLPELMEYTRKEATRLFESGGLNTESYDNNYELPKLCLTVALENQAHQYMHPAPIRRKELANLRHF